MGKFLIPLQRYFASLMPLQKTISPFHSPPRLKPFNEEEFLSLLSVKSYLTPKGGKSKKEVELYRLFISSQNFHGWFNVKRAMAIEQLRHLYRRALSEIDIDEALGGRSDVEVIDLYMRVKDELELGQFFNEQIKSKLESDLEVITEALPSDLRRSLGRSQKRDAAPPSTDDDAPENISF